MNADPKDTKLRYVGGVLRVAENTSPAPAPVVLAFLQNVWVKDPEWFKRQVAEGGEARRLKLMRRLLFMQCLSGRRLKQAFGDGLCQRIVWEESTREVAGDPRTVFPADMGHIAAALRRHEPAVVLTFGVVARDAVAELWGGPCIQMPHPAARQRDTSAKLNAGASLLREWLGTLNAEQAGGLAA